MNEVIVEYDYTAKESDELTIKKGDIIKDVVKKPGGWWEGVLKDKKGMFPDNFVRPLDKDGVVLRNSKDVCRIKQCRVVFSYNQDHEDELNLKVGDVIDIIGEEEEGWWRGTLNGKEGVFPSNFVKEISFQPNPSKRVSYGVNDNDSKPPKLPAKPTKQLCEATYPYKAQNDDEISFKEGDIITLISKDSQDPGWWQGELNGKVGFFPDNFVVLISSDNKLNSKEEKKTHSKSFPDSTGAIKSVASQRKSLEPKSEKLDKSDGDISTHNKTPPIPSKKPIVSIKKSPSGSGAGFISEIKKKIVDVVDGTASSRMVHKEKEVVVENTDNAFDQVERRPLLADPRAGRVKAPGRRPPTTIMHKDEPSTISNGCVDTNHHESQVIDNEVKPRLREWEKHKAPWLEEMKQNQVKRTMTTSMDGQIVEVENMLSKSQSEKEMDSPKSLSPPNPKLKTPSEPEKPEKGPPPPKPSSTHITKDIPATPSQPIIIPKEAIPPKVSPTKPIPTPNAGSKNVSTADILERLEALEEAVRKQNQVIEDLRNKLMVETEMRMFLQEKVLQNVQV